jgi:hypothetical protein
LKSLEKSNYSLMIMKDGTPAVISGAGLPLFGESSPSISGPFRFSLAPSGRSLGLMIPLAKRLPRGGVELIRAGTFVVDNSPCH